MTLQKVIVISIISGFIGGYTSLMVLSHKDSPMPSTSQKSSAYDQVVRSGVIRCGYAESPPGFMIDPNTKEKSGIDYDIWQEIGMELGLRIEYTEEVGWGNFIEGLKTNHYDAFCAGLWADPARIKFLSITKPSYYSFLHGYTRPDDTRFNGNIDRINQEDVTIPAIDGDVSVSMVKAKFPKAKIHYLPQTANVSDMFMSVTSRKADVIFVDFGMFELFEKTNPRQLTRIPEIQAAYTYPTYYGVNAGEFQFRDMINIALDHIIDDGRMERILLKYSKDYAPSAKGFQK